MASSLPFKPNSKGTGCGMRNGAAALRRGLNHHVTRLLHFWVRTRKSEKRKVRKKDLYTHVLSSVTHSSPEVGATQVSDEWMNGSTKCGLSMRWA